MTLTAPTRISIMSLPWLSLPWFFNGNVYRSIEPCTISDATEEYEHFVQLLPTYNLPPAFDPVAFMNTANAWQVEDDDLPIDGLFGLMYVEHASPTNNFSKRIKTEWLRPHLAKFIKLGSRKPKKMCSWCGFFGFSKLLQQCIDRGYRINYVLSSCSPAISGDLECLKIMDSYLVSTCQNYDGARNRCCSIAIQYGHIHCLRWLADNGYFLTHSCTDIAIEFKQFECLVYLHSRNCPWSAYACKKAVRSGIRFLRYAHENGCEMNSTDITAVSSEFGQLECLQYAHENGCPWTEKVITQAIKRNHPKCLEYAHQNGCPIPIDAMNMAAHYGRLNCMRYLHENGVPWNEYHIISCKNIQCLQYALEHECPISVKAMNLFIHQIELQPELDYFEKVKLMYHCINY